MINLKVDELFEYQNTGYQWLTSKEYALLADEMGLGKSVQAIRGLECVPAPNTQSPSIIVCPSVARHNWENEFSMWAILDHDIFVATEIKDLPSPKQTLICSFDYAVANYKRLNEIRSKAGNKWKRLIIDEFHFTKNPGTQRAKALLGREGIIHYAHGMWALTGTPAPNNASELWLILFLTGQTKLSFDDFVLRFCHTRKTSYGLKVTGTNQFRNEELRQLLKPIMLRRLKKDVMKDLPPITHKFQVVEPGIVHFDIQPSFTQYCFPVDRRDELLMKLERERAVVKGILEAEKHEASKNQKLKALSEIQNSVSTLRRINGLQKIESFAQHIRECFRCGIYEKVVVFAIHQDVIEGLRKELKEFKPVTLFGRTNADTRVKNINKFNTNPKCKVFIGNIIAAGTAINLTAAHDIYLLEQDWVPGNNAQAIMRVHRIGQTHPVTVRYVSLPDSIDKYVAQIVKKKTKELTEIFDK